MIATTEKDKKMLRAAGGLLGSVLQKLAAHAVPDMDGAELDRLAESLIREGGGEPIFLGYETDGAPFPYPAALCLSINDEVVHSIPTEAKVLKEGDVVSLDLGLSLGGYVVDAAVTVIVGEGDEDAKRLLEGTKKSLMAQIAATKAGATLGDLGAAAAAVAASYKLSVVHDLGGHGTGEELHEAPYVSNFGTKGKGEKLRAGQVLALEPILTLGSGAIEDGDDGWTYKTRDGSRAAQFEHTVLVTEDGAEILTQA